MERIVYMGEFKALTQAQIKELDELLKIADATLGTKTSVIKGNPQSAKIVGTAIGGATGAAIAASAGAAGVAGALGTAGTVGTASFIGGGSLAAGGGIALGVAALPVAIIALLVGGISYLFGKKRAKKKEAQRQAMYVKTIAEKMQKILDKYEALKKQFEQTSKDKNDLINELKEKLAEYEAIFEALMKKRKDLENNISYV